MLQSRIYTFPPTKTIKYQMKIAQDEGSPIETTLEYKDQNIKIGDYSYNVFVGSTAGKKGYPNQDFAGLAQKYLEIGNKKYDCLLTIVADGVSLKEFSEKTSESIVKTTTDIFSTSTKKYNTFGSLAGDLWKWVSDGADKSNAPQGASTVSLYLFAANGEETKGIAINCGDSRVYWATQKYVETVRVQTEVLNPRNAISFALGTDRDNKNMQHDTYLVDNPVEVFLCTDTFAYEFDGVHFPDEMITCLKMAVSRLDDHLTTISIKRI